MIGHGSGHAKGSGVEIDQPFAMLWKVRAGKLVFGQTFTDPAEALRAEGPAEDGSDAGLQ